MALTASRVQGTDGVELAYTEAGHGDPPLLLVHGFTGGKVDWTDVHERLAERRRVAAYDHRGHHESGHAAGPDQYTFGALAADLSAVVGDKALGPMHLLGHSMGGIVSLTYVLAHPEEVRSLILMDTMAEPPKFDLAAFMSDVIAAGRTKGMATVAEMMAKLSESMPTYGPPEQVAAIRARNRAKLEAMDPEAYATLASRLGTFDSMVGRLGEIACPTTVIVGEHDKGLRGAADTLAAGIPGAVLEVIPASAHCPQEENTEAWLAAVEHHLARS